MEVEVSRWWWGFKVKKIGVMQLECSKTDEEVKKIGFCAFFFFKLNRPLMGLFFSNRVTLGVGSTLVTRFCNSLQRCCRALETWSHESIDLCCESHRSVDSSDSGTESARSGGDSSTPPIQTSIRTGKLLTRIESHDSNRESCDSDNHGANNQQMRQIKRHLKKF